MQLEWTDSGEAFADRAASHVAALLAETPAAAVALPTGSTPIGLYGRLRALAAAGEVTFSAGHYFNLDEYVGVAPTDRHSFAAFLRRHFLAEADIPPDHIRLLRGDAPEVPSHGLTMGIGMIRAARRVLLMVSGAGKADALAALLDGAPDPTWPVTALCGHPNLTVVADSVLRADR
jgi:glucosamine-6-phosphate deaminase